MKSQILKIWSRNLSLHPWFFPTVLFAVALTFPRSFLPPTLTSVLHAGLFVLGVVLAHLVDTAEDLFLLTTSAVFDRLEKIEKPHGESSAFQPLMPMEPVSAAHTDTNHSGIHNTAVGHTTPHAQKSEPVSHSVLRQPPLFILVPLCGLFLLTSSQSDLGLGFVWGLTVLLGKDLWPALQGKTEHIRQQLLPHWTEGNSVLPLFATGFWIYLAILTLSLALW